MAQFDDAFEAPLPNAIPGDRMGFIENQLQYLYSELTHLRGTANQAPTPQPRPNLNLSHQSKFSGTPSDLPMFKLRLYQYLMGNFNTYYDHATQLLYAGSLLEGPAAQWYSTIRDPTTLLLPPSYTLDSFWEELEAFFGGGSPSRPGSAPLITCVTPGVCQTWPFHFKTLHPPSPHAGVITLSFMFFPKSLKRWSGLSSCPGAPFRLPFRLT